MTRHSPPGWLVLHNILGPDLSDLTGYIHDTLPEGQDGGAR